MKNYIEVLKKYRDFKGRSARKEFWMFVLVSFIIGLGLGILMSITESMGVAFIGWAVFLIYWLATIVPNIALNFRRLHDTGRSAWWLLIALIPYVGAIVLLVFYCLDSQPGDNKYGPNPKGVSAPSPASMPAAETPSDTV